MSMDTAATVAIMKEEKLRGTILTKGEHPRVHEEGDTKAGAGIERPRCSKVELDNSVTLRKAMGLLVII